MIAGHRVAALLSFEGPDRYASVGGLGSRETSFARALGDAGVETTLIFVGDPTLPAVEAYAPGVTLRRWCQWISAFHPRDVYDGEANKVRDYTASVPQFVVDDIVVPAIGSGTRVLVIAEEWQTVGATIALDALLRERGLRDRVTMLWNANNTYGFERIDWIALQAAASVVTISKYMKFELSRIGVPALVVPNGIHDRLLDGPPRELVTLMRSSMRGKPALVKVGRFDPDKNWLQAIDAVVELRAAGHTRRKRSVCECRLRARARAWSARRNGRGRRRRCRCGCSSARRERGRDRAATRVPPRSDVTRALRRRRRRARQ
jgi:glycosyltransferase involved in cell wall biosynthesis